VANSWLQAPRGGADTAGGSQYVLGQRELGEVACRNSPGQSHPGMERREYPEITFRSASDWGDQVTSSQPLRLGQLTPRSTEGDYNVQYFAIQQALSKLQTATAQETQ
jgi:hypothetical protein